MARAKRQMNDVPQATMVITNPTHIAIALKYDRGMTSPKVLAVGADLIAEQIKKIAREAGVPLVENVALARGLFKSVRVGDEIPSSCTRPWPKCWPTSTASRNADG